MTCPHCESWAPVTRTKLATRERNIALGGEIYACPKCGTRDWATNKSKIVNRTRSRIGKTACGLLYITLILVCAGTFWFFSR